ncbi:MAG: hypothetical protein KY455_03215 [Euryarchaeota archaeon]|nr:hypothetical protein [Euryarchaeota archaeon]
MASKVVQFRVPEESVRWLREQGINPNDAAREAFEGLLRRARAESNYRALRKLAEEQSIRRSKSAADIIRAERDSH